MNADAATPLPGPVAIVAHDAGGAELVASYARRAGLHGVVVAAGPALAVMDGKLPSWPRRSLDEAIAASSWLLTGTSWQSDLEWTALGLARQSGRPTVTYLDHWVNYRERFVRAGDVRWPDQVWVADRLAEAIARRDLPGLELRLAGNPYLEDIQERLAQLRAARPTPQQPHVLYVCEPVREHALKQHGNERHWGYTEEEAIEYFFARRAGAGLADYPVVLRPHPAEPAGKYQWATERWPAVTIGGQLSLLDEVVDAAALAGCESMAMVIGLAAGKRVVSCIPPGGRPGSLPHPEIEILSQMSSTGAISR
jgi:hypothetical protein